MSGAGEQALLWVRRMEQVEWAKLDYAYGNATNVSGLIRTIAFGEHGQAARATVRLARDAHREVGHRQESDQDEQSDQEVTGWRTAHHTPHSAVMK